MPYLGKSPSAGVRQRYQYTATAGQTTFSGTDLGNLTLTYTDNNFVDVFQNGVLLKGGGTDYTATSGTSVVLATGASVSDVIEIIVYDVFSVGNFFNRTDSDSRYILEGIDDQSSSNDDQITITDSAVVINEDSDDVDFRVESNGNINMLHVDGGSDLVTIGGLTGTSGNEDAGYGPLQVGNTASSGTILQMLANSSETTTIHFGDAVSGDGRFAGYMQYAHSDDSFQLGVAGSAIGFKIYSGGNFEKMGNSDQARIIPQSDNAGFLGESTKRWQAVYAVNGSIQTSDKNMKTEITDSSLGLDFIKALRPVSYKWKSGGKSFSYDKDDLKKENPIITDVAGKRNHYGLIAQEVKEALGDTDFGGWVSEDVTDENATQSLRYSQFIAPLVKAVQELSAKNDALEARIKKLEDG